MNKREVMGKSFLGFIIICIVLVSCGENPVKSEIEELTITDFTVEQNTTYFLTGENDVYKMISSHVAILYAKDNTAAYYKLKLKELCTDMISERIGEGYYSHICRDDTVCYGIILAGWSSRFVIVNPVTGEEKFLRYLAGIPAGLCVSNEKLWYLTNRGSHSSILFSYDKNTGSDIDDFVTPLYNTAGLIIDDDGNFTTYEKDSISFVNFKIANDEIMLLMFKNIS